MHELSIAQGIIDIVCQHLPAGESQRVSLVRVRVGDMAGVVPESLSFCFDVIAGTSPLRGAKLVIDHVPVVIRCGQCGREHSMEHQAFPCPHCSSRDVTMISGNELSVVEIEVVDEKAEVS